jgi:hypothetical protein
MCGWYPLVYSSSVKIPFEDHPILLGVVHGVVAVEDDERDGPILDHGGDQHVVEDDGTRT